MPASRLLALATVALPAIAASAPCPPAPEAVRDIEANRYYVDAASSIVDPALKAKKDAAVKPLKDFARALSARADRYVADDDADAARCALDWLAAWGEGGAMLGKMSSRQSEYERKWTLAALAIAYLKVKPEANAAHRASIEPWLRRVGNAAQRFFDDPERSRNNHYYWTALGVGAVGAATGSAPHWEFARQAYRDATAAIAADGTLPLELARQRRALWYHNYALAPLVVLAEIAALRGEDWYATNGGALHRLAATTLAGMDDPGIFGKLTGFEQDGIARGEIAGDGLAWVEFYARRFPEKNLARWLDRRRVYVDLGGDLGALANRWQSNQTRSKWIPSN